MGVRGQCVCLIPCPLWAGIGISGNRSLWRGGYVCRVGNIHTSRGGCIPEEVGMSRGTHPLLSGRYVQGMGTHPYDTWDLGYYEIHPTGMLSCYLPQWSCEGYVFTRVCLSTGGECLGMYPLRNQVPPPGPGTPPWDQVYPLGPGTPPMTRNTPWDQVHLPTRYTPRDQVHPWDQVHPPGPGTPPRRRLLLRTVRILLECILVYFCFLSR